MTIEIGTRNPGITSDQASATQQALFEALRKGEGGAPLLRTLLRDTKLSSEQQAFVDLLIELENQPSGTVEEPTTSGESAELMELKEELADLREANDTVAAALGACPYCWGGNRRCEVCRGRGRAGFTEPDPALFNELVLPAIQRARAMMRAGSRPRSGRARS